MEEITRTPTTINKAITNAQDGPAPTCLSNTNNGAATRGTSKEQRPKREARPQDTKNTRTSHLAQPREQPAHGRVVEGLVAVEHQHETPQLRTEGLDRLRLTRAGRAEGVAAHAEVQRLGQGEVTPAFVHVPRQRERLRDGGRVICKTRYERLGVSTSEQNERLGPGTN